MGQLPEVTPPQRPPLPEPAPIPAFADTTLKAIGQPSNIPLAMGLKAAAVELVAGMHLDELVVAAARDG